jgi:hypothetical protein
LAIQESLKPTLEIKLSQELVGKADAPKIVPKINEMTLATKNAPEIQPQQNNLLKQNLPKQKD